MKITRKQLNKIIKESLSLLTEDTYHTVEGECVDGLWLSIDVVKNCMAALEDEDLATGETQAQRDKALKVFTEMRAAIEESEPNIKGLCFKDDDIITGRDGLCPGKDTLSDTAGGPASGWLEYMYLMTRTWCNDCGGLWTGQDESDGVEFNKCSAQEPKDEPETPELKQMIPEPEEEGGTGLYGKIPAGDPCFDGRPDSYVMAGRKSFGDWVYKLSKQNKKAKDQWGGETFAPLAEKLRAKMTEEDASELQMSMITDVEMEVYKVTKKGETGTEADATSKRVGFTFLLKDIKPRKSEEAASWDAHPLSGQVLEYLKTGGGTIDCPAGDAMREGKLNRQQLREFISKTSGCGC